MSEPADWARSGASGSVVLERAETLLGRLGERVNEARASAAERAGEARARVADAAQPAAPPAARAEEEILDRWGQWLGAFAVAVSREARRAAALAREEAEDVYAEAQSLRRRGTP